MPAEGGLVGIRAFFRRVHIPSSPTQRTRQAEFGSALLPKGEGTHPPFGRIDQPEGLSRGGGVSQRGSVTIWGIGLTLVIAAFAGLVIDTWRVFAERQDLSGMADSAAIAGATAIDVAHLNESGEVVLQPTDAELRALDYLTRQDGWSADIVYTIVAAADGSNISVVLEKDVDFTLLGPLLPNEEPLHVTVSSRASPNVVSP
ncbi:MAG: hypothetical protein GY722_08860 [bacterium]|nr:hypothetical protein [bacterium]